MNKTILIMMHRIARGGAETQFRYLTNELARRGYRVVLCLENYHAEDDAYIAQMHPGLEIEKMGWNYYDSSNVPKGRMEKIRSLVKACIDSIGLIRKYKVCSVLMYSRMALMLIPIFKMCGVKVVFSERNTGKTILSKKHYSKILKLADEITANSRQATEYYHSKGFERTKTIYNGVEHSLYKTHVEKESFVDGMYVLVPARVSPIKNQMLVLRALEKLSDLKIHVDFAGNAEDTKYLQQLKEEAKSRNLEDKLTFCGHLTNMKDRYSMYDLVILPSLAEGMPNVLLESAAARVMSFYSNISMNLDVMQRDDYSFSVDNPVELAEMIRKWSYEKNREEIVCGLVDRIISEYSMESMVDKYVKLMCC